MIRHLFLPCALAGAAALCATSLRAAAPVFPAHPNETDTPMVVPPGKALVIPIACDDADGDSITYTVTSSNPHVFARFKTGNPHLKIHVHTDHDGTSAPYDGDMEFQLFRDFAPDDASFIAGYAQSGYYDNVTFHRIISGFVIQGGDPAGTGSGKIPDDPATTGVNEFRDLNLNYNLPHEFRPELIFSGRGQLAMANSFGGYTFDPKALDPTIDPALVDIPLNTQFPPNGNTRYRTARFQPTNGTQFFITLDPQRHLDFKHPIFGQLIRGFDVMDKVEALPKSGEKPIVAVKMTSLSVAPSKTDAVLLVTATTTGTSVLTVKATDSNGETATRTINVSATSDTVNDPPILEAFEPVVMPVGGVPSFRVRSFDLESDAISTRFPVLDFFTKKVIYAGLSSDNLRAVARPAAGAWDVTVSVAGLRESVSSADPFDDSRFQILEVGVGDRPLTVTPETVEATAAVSTGSVRVATFKHGGTGVTASDFLATVEWGDGANAQSSSESSPKVTIARSPANPSLYEVRATHTYARPGIYPLRVIVDGPLGTTDTGKGTVVVSAAGATLKAMGEQIEFNASPLYSGRPLATFSDTTPGAKLANYEVTLDWGDGLRAPGSMRQTGAGQFSVFGVHRYLDATTYSVAVHIHRLSPAADTVAWTTIKMGGFAGPPQLPPFAKANITSYWTESPTKIYRGGAVDVAGTLFLINGGQKPTPKWTVRMWLSNNTTLVTSGAGADTQLQFGPLNKLVKELPLNALPPGGGGNFGFKSQTGADFTIRLPAGETGAGKYLIAQLDYSDPITDHMAVPKSVVYGPLNGILVTSAQVITVAESPTSATHSATFKVRLDTLPTADVKIPFEIVNYSDGVVNNARAVLDKTELIFTSGFGTSDQTVTVTAKDDTDKNNTGTFIVRLKPAISADPRFSGMDGPDVYLQVTDNEP